MQHEQLVEKKGLRERIKILIVDDSPSIRELIKLLLEGMGFKEIHLVGDGYGSLKAFKEINPDLTFLDMNLPTMSGLEALKIMLSMNSSSKIILTTAFPRTDKNIMDAISLGANYYLEKPLDRKSISDVIERIEREEEGSSDRGNIKAHVKKIEAVKSQLSESPGYLVFEFETSDAFNDFSLAISQLKNVSVKGIQFYKGRFVVTVEIMPEIDIAL